MAVLGKSVGWLLKGLAAAGLTVTAVPTYHLSTFANLRVNDPEAALRDRRGDALAARAVLADRMSENGEFEIERANLTEAHRNRPLVADLIAMRGQIQDEHGKLQQALKTMQLANWVSRRSVPANLWLIEAASSSGDVGAVVRHYHAALAVHPELEKPLLPILAQGIAYPDVRAALKPYLIQPTRWTGAFLEEANRTANPANLAALLHPLPTRLLAEDYQASLGAILHRLAVEEGHEAAIRFAGQIIPGFQPETLIKLGLSPETRDQRLGPLAWNLQSNERIEVDVREGQMLEINAQPLSRGQVAVRDILVTGGRTYVFTQRVSFGGNGGNSRLRWGALCIGKDETNSFWDQQVPPSRKPVRYRSVVRVPNDCSVARLTLVVGGPDGQLPASISIDELKLVQQF